WQLVAEEAELVDAATLGTFQTGTPVVGYPYLVKGMVPDVYLVDTEVVPADPPPEQSSTGTGAGTGTGTGVGGGAANDDSADYGGPVTGHCTIARPGADRGGLLALSFAAATTLLLARPRRRRR